MTARTSSLLFAGVIRIISQGCRGALRRALLFLEEIALSEPYRARFLVIRSGSLSLLLNVLLDFFRHGNEGLFNVDGALGRGLKEGDFKVSCELCALLLGYLTDLFHVALISDENFADTWVGEAIDLYHPLAHVFERISIRHIIHYNDAMSTSVIAASECAESLLSCGVPNLQLHYLLVKHYGLDFLHNVRISFTYKVDSDGVEKVLVKRIFLISEKYIGYITETWRYEFGGGELLLLQIVQKLKYHNLELSSKINAMTYRISAHRETDSLCFSDSPIILRVLLLSLSFLVLSTYSIAEE